MENFLRKSPSFVKWAESLKSKNNLLAVLDSIALLCSKEDSLSKKQVRDKLRKQGFDLSTALAGNYCLLFKSAYAYLVDTAENKREKFQKKFSDSEPTDYYRFINQGIRCLIKDGIDSFSRNKSDSDNSSKEANTGNVVLSSILKEVGKDSEKESHAQHIVLPDQCKEIDEQDEAMSKAISIIESTFEKQRNLCERLQYENCSLRKDLEAETDRRFELRKELDAAEVKVSDFEKEIRDLSGVVKGLRAQLEKAKEKNQLAEINKKIDEGNKKIELLLNQQRNSDASQVKKKSEEKLEEKEEILPLIYKPDGREIEYGKRFMKKFNETKFYNPKMKNRVVKLIKQICKNGINGVSDVKTIPLASNHTPANSLQRGVGKNHRITFQRRKGKLVFYELFDRRDSPFAKNRS